MRSVPILHLCYGGVGGQATAAQVLATEFKGLAIASAVVSVGPPGELLPEGAWSDFTEVAIVPVTRRADLGSMVGVMREVRRFQPRVIVCHSHRHAPAAFAGALLSGRFPRLVTVEHHAVALRSRGDNLRSLMSLMLSRAVVFLTPSARDGYPLRAWGLPGPRRSRVIPNGLAAIAESPSHRHDGLVLGMASRLVGTKRIDTLVDALSILAASRPALNPFLRIAGDGPCRQTIVKQVSRLGLEARVELLGEVQPADMPDFYSSLDVYTHATDGENLSFAILEAAQRGLPIVASRVAGIDNLLEDGVTACLVPPNSPTALALAVERMGHSEAGAAMGARARSWVAETYAGRAMMRAYAEVFSAVDPRGPWKELL